MHPAGGNCGDEVAQVAVADAIDDEDRHVYFSLVPPLRT